MITKIAKKLVILRMTASTVLLFTQTGIQLITSLRIAFEINARIIGRHIWPFFFKVHFQYYACNYFSRLIELGAIQLSIFLLLSVVLSLVLDF